MSSRGSPGVVLIVIGALHVFPPSVDREKRIVEFLQREVRPADVEIPGVAAVRVVGHHVRLVLERNPRRGRVLNHRDVLRLPRHSSVERTPNENAVARGVMRPVIGRAQLVERDVAQNRVPAIVVRHRYVARNQKIRRRCARSRKPLAPAVVRIGHVSVVLVSRNHLSRIERIHRNRRLRVPPRLRRQPRHMRARRWRQNASRSTRRLCPRAPTRAKSRARKRGDADKASKSPWDAVGKFTRKK